MYAATVHKNIDVPSPYHNTNRIGFILALIESIALNQVSQFAVKNVHNQTIMSCPLSNQPNASAAQNNIPS